MEEYKIVKEAGSATVTEKKSRFIGQCVPVENEQEAIAIIENTRKKYWDSRHNCYAYVIGKDNAVQRFSDDGEPQGTAGKPILEVITGDNLRNVLIIVTRYFGGTLLGTGGLIRAYTEASKQAIKASVTASVIPGVKTKIVVSYNDIGKIKHILSNFKASMIKETYTDQVEISAVLGKSDYESFKSEVNNITGGKAGFLTEDIAEYEI